MVAMAGILAFGFTKGDLKKMAAPYDQGASMCGFDATYGTTDMTDYGFLYFTNLITDNMDDLLSVDDIFSQGICVKSCPTQDDISMSTSWFGANCKEYVTTGESPRTVSCTVLPDQMYAS